ncbi:MAG: transcriptional regulator NrdR family protein [Granulosicoccus sp.]|jgi:transcriptional regulator NrdR family protein
MSISVLKSSGDRAPFDERKLCRSLERSGASADQGHSDYY